jgi:hypothetical protein
MSEKNEPTTTGLMNRGTTKSTISTRRPRKLLTIARASTKPSTSSTSTTAADSSSVTHSACLATGSFQTFVKLSSPTQRCPGIAKS